MLTSLQLIHVIRLYSAIKSYTCNEIKKVCLRKDVCVSVAVFHDVYAFFFIFTKNTVLVFLCVLKLIVLSYRPINVCSDSNSCFVTTLTGGNAEHLRYVVVCLNWAPNLQVCSVAYRTHAPVRATVQVSKFLIPPLPSNFTKTANYDVEKKLQTIYLQL